ncbi:Uncharacterised protein [Mycolicibacterium gilvum]|uniref:Uncharacterized protein n=1 Tax=Mycolicibacterium gilvum TaxID=1804 RepID=A0A379MMM6_9MYCO|nr:Uncharacterised protein [Mycolicibacterium gilvum]
MLCITSWITPNSPGRRASAPLSATINERIPGVLVELRRIERVRVGAGLRVDGQRAHGRRLLDEIVQREPVVALAVEFSGEDAGGHLDVVGGRQGRRLVEEGVPDVADERVPPRFGGFGRRGGGRRLPIGRGRPCARRRFACFDRWGRSVGFLDDLGGFGSLGGCAGPVLDDRDRFGRSVGLAGLLLRCRVVNGHAGFVVLRPGSDASASPPTDVGLDDDFSDGLPEVRVSDVLAPATDPHPRRRYRQRLRMRRSATRWRDRGQRPRRQQSGDIAVVSSLRCPTGCQFDCRAAQVERRSVHSDPRRPVRQRCRPVSGTN